MASFGAFGGASVFKMGSEVSKKLHDTCKNMM
jgi:hypothetical protein